jgi:hypothetical protein
LLDYGTEVSKLGIVKTENNMDNLDDNLTLEEYKKMVYLAGLRLKNSGLDEETIYARLEKKGVPEDLARQVARDVRIERKREHVKELETGYNFALIRVGIGLLAAVVSAFVFPGNIIIPIGLIIGGVISALMIKKRIDE